MRYLFVIPFLFFCCMAEAFAGVSSQPDSKSLTYDQTIQIISNLSDVNSQRSETRSIKQLLEQNIGGFRFHLLWDHESGQILYKKPDGTHLDFKPVLNQISDFIEDHPSRILTLFLDIDLPIDSLKKTFREEKLEQYFFEKSSEKGWPRISEMIQTDQRIVIFAMQQVSNIHLGYTTYGITLWNRISHFLKHRTSWGNFLKEILKMIF